MFKIRKGLDLPIAGVPEPHVSPGASVRHVAILGDDYLGMRPSMLVQEGDRVIKGQALFEDKKILALCLRPPRAVPWWQSIAVNVASCSRWLSVLKATNNVSFPVRRSRPRRPEPGSRSGTTAGVRLVDGVSHATFQQIACSGYASGRYFRHCH